MGEWVVPVVSAVCGVAAAVITAAGVFALRYYRGKGGYVRDVATARVAVTDAERKARREDEDAERAARRADDEAERAREEDVLEEYKELVKALKRERAEDRQLIHELRDEMVERAAREAQCEVRLARAFERIGALEDALVAAKIPHRRFDPDASSGFHRPLPPGAEHQ